MKLRECIELYIDMKQKNGHPYIYSSARLRRFATATGDIQLGAVTVDHVLKFIETPRASTITRQFKHGLLRNFFLHCKGRYAMGQMPMPPKPPDPLPNAFIPRVYSRAEIRMLVRAVAPSQADAQCLISARAFRTQPESPPPSSSAWTAEISASTRLSSNFVLLLISTLSAPASSAIARKAWSGRSTLRIWIWLSQRTNSSIPRLQTISSPAP